MKPNTDKAEWIAQVINQGYERLHHKIDEEGNVSTDKKFLTGHTMLLWSYSNQLKHLANEGDGNTTVEGVQRLHEEIIQSNIEDKASGLL